MEVLITLLVGGVFVIALSMGGFSRETENKKGVWQDALILTVVFIVIGAVLSLSGCSSSPSIEEETESKVKLIEYELCLETQQEIWKGIAQGQTLEKLVLKACEDKRP